MISKPASGNDIATYSPIMTEPEKTERAPVEQALTAGGGAVVSGAVLWWLLIDNSLNMPTVGWQVAVGLGALLVFFGSSWLARTAAKDAWQHRNTETLDSVITAGISALILIGGAATAAVVFFAGGTPIDGPSVATGIEEQAEDRGVEGLSVSCPEKMTARDGREERCTFAAPDGSSGLINVTWDGDDGQYIWLVEVGAQ